MDPALPAVDRPRRVGLVLSGGGSRGAYEVGVIRYLREELPRQLGRHVNLDIICGTSVGAINACFMASSAEDPASQGRRLGELWESLALDQVYRRKGLAGLSPIVNLLNDGARDILGAKNPQPLFRSLLDTSPLRDLLRHQISWDRIGPNIEAGSVHALAVSTTNLDTGQTFIFVQNQSGDLPGWHSGAMLPVMTTIRAEHALASAAIPLLFPAVELDGAFHCDGGLRQNTPLSPALQLGAEKLLVIGLHYQRAAGESMRLGRARRYGGYPATGQVLGKVLNSIFLDPVDYDLGQLELINRFLDAGVSAYGPDFLDVISQATRAAGEPDRRYRPVPVVFIQPSRDLGQIAARYVRTSPLAEFDLGLLQRVLFRVNDLDTATESDLSSYLLFDGEYAAELVALGMADAHARRAELLAFFANDA